MALIKKIWNNLYKRLDFTVYSDIYWYFAALLLAIPAQLYLPVSCGYETGIVENSQLVILFIGMIICCCSKHKKPMFYAVAAILFIMMLRETNFGKTIFYPDPNRPNRFLSWDEIWYAPYVDPVLITYGVLVAAFAIWKKLWIPLWKYISQANIVIWHFAAFVFAAVVSSVLDKFKLEILEEMVELAAYIAMIGLIRIYAFRISPDKVEK